MKLFMVIYLVGVIGGTVGPLPYDKAECDRRAAEMAASLDPTIVTPDGYRASDVRFICEWHDVRPNIGN